MHGARADREAGGDLADQLVAFDKTIVLHPLSLLLELEVVVEKADRPHPDRREQRDPDIWMRATEARPERHRDQRRREEDQPSHRRRRRLRGVRVRGALAHDLMERLPLALSDDQGTDKKRQKY